MRYIKYKSLMCVFLIAILVFSSSLLVFAGDNSELVDRVKSAKLVKNVTLTNANRPHHNGFKAAVDKLVEEGKLSRQKAEDIYKYLQEKKQDKEFRKNHKFGFLAELENAKIISSQEAELIKNKLKENRAQAFNEKLTALVKDGTITQAQAEKITQYFQKSREQKKEQFKQLEKMTKEQREEFFKQHKKDGAIDKLVEDGVLTQEQGEKLEKVLRKNHCKCDKH